MTDALCAWADQGCEPIQANLDSADWWALMKRRENERETLADDTAGLLEAAREIAKYCARIDGCFKCPFASRINGLCVVRGIPADWRIIKEG